MKNWKKCLQCWPIMNSLRVRPALKAPQMNVDVKCETVFTPSKLTQSTLFPMKTVLHWNEVMLRIREPFLLSQKFQKKKQPTANNTFYRNEFFTIKWKILLLFNGEILWNRLNAKQMLLIKIYLNKIISTCISIEMNFMQCLRKQKEKYA